MAYSRNKREGAGIAVAWRVRLGRHLATFGHLADEAAIRRVRIRGAAHVLVSLCGKRCVSFKNTENKCGLLGMLSSHRCAHVLCIRHARAACRRECEVQNGITQPLHKLHGSLYARETWAGAQLCCLAELLQVQSKRGAEYPGVKELLVRLPAHVALGPEVLHRRAGQVSMSARSKGEDQAAAPLRRCNAAQFPLGQRT